MKIFLSIFAIFISLNLFAQQSSITGTVSGGGEVSGAIVTLLKSSDSSVIKTTLSEANGNFTLSNLMAGNYLLSISHVGYIQYYTNTFSLGVSQQLQFEKISLLAASKDLKEITVTGRKQFIERKIDRLVINPDAIIGNAGGNALEVLEKAPGIQVDANGNISYKGKQGVMVFVDDKPTYLAAQDLGNYLRSLPAGSIETVELMANPPAKYDAAGNSGIINIRLKKNTLKGFNGSLSIGYGQGRYHRTNNSFNINYRVNKVNIYANLSWNQNHSYHDLTINRNYFTSTGIYKSAFTQNSYIKREIEGINLRVGADYYMSKKSTAGIVISGFENRTFSPVRNRSSIINEINQVDSTVLATNPENRKWKNGSINLNYTYKINDKGSEISANADFLNYQADITQQLESQNFNPTNTLSSKSILQSFLPADLQIQSFKADYLSPLKGNAKL